MNFRAYFNIFVSISILFGLFVGQISTQAHFVQSQNGIGGVIHIDPNDEPIVDKLSGIFIDLKDTQNRLTETNCDCKLVIIQNGKKLTENTVQISKSNDKQLFVTSEYTFANKGVYTVQLSGKSTKNEFSSFELNYDFYVNRKVNQQNYGDLILPGILISLVLLSGVGYVLTKKLQAKKI